MNAENAVEIRGLKKKFKDTEALRGVTFRIPKGSLCGLVGLNGAGKTTTIKALLELLRPDEGEIHALGISMGKGDSGQQIRSRSAFVPERKELFPYMRVGDVVEFTKSFYPLWNGQREQRLKERLGLDYAKKIPALSKGTLSKLHLLLALSRGAELLILDEPTDGLDALATQVVQEELVSLVADEGTTVLHCSHRMEEVEQIADYLVVLHEGKVLLEKPLDELRGHCRRLHFVFPEDTAGAFEQLKPLGIARLQGRTVSLLSIEDSAQAEALGRSLGAREVEAEALTLRQLFVELVRN